MKKMTANVILPHPVNLIFRRQISQHPFPYHDELL